MLQLVHFTDDPNFMLDRTRRYQQPPNAYFGENSDDQMCYVGKPAGLWLSEESRYGWTQWKEDNQFRTEEDLYTFGFAVPTERLLILNESTEPSLIQNLVEQCDGIWNWDTIASQYSGVLFRVKEWFWDWYISDSQCWNWVFGWDCDSVCLWDLTGVIEEGTVTIASPRVERNT